MTLCCTNYIILCAGATAVSRAGFGQGTGPIVLNQVQCSGTEGQLVNCPANASGVRDCLHSNDAGVRCQSSKH